MLISRNWLQTFFDQPLPDAAALSTALTFHAFEIDGISRIGFERPEGTDHILDVKVTPNRGHDCLSHIGIAKELSAILRIPLARHISGESKIELPVTAQVAVSIDTPLCRRYIAGYITGVKVGPSPDWLRERLESIGQRSINNIVDATNYVMFNVGQPLHAFDAGKLEQKDGTLAVAVRAARAGEKLRALDEKEYTLDMSMLVITDAHTDTAIGVAGVKGGAPAGISEETTNIILEAANFEAVSVRKTAQALKLRTDASARFEQVLSPELAACGVQAVADLILSIAGGELQGFVDVYPIPQEKKTATVSVEQVNRALGTSFTGAEVADVFQRLGFAYKEENGVFEVVVPVERLDIEIPEDLIEEVGRVQGYDKVLPVELPPLGRPIEVNKNFYWAEKIREFLVAQGFSEVYTSVFAESGERVVLNKVDGVKPYLRGIINHGLTNVVHKNLVHKDMLGISKVKIFEIGPVWENGKEIVQVETLEEQSNKKDSSVLMHGTHKPLEAFAQELGLSDAPATYDNLPTSTTQQYQPFSKYPYVVRDIAMWIPDGMKEMDVWLKIKNVLIDSANNIPTTVKLLDEFQKENRISLAYRIIFQSFDRTLVDEEVNACMEKVYTKLQAQGFEIR